MGAVDLGIAHWTEWATVIKIVQGSLDTWIQSAGLSIGNLVEIIEYGSVLNGRQCESVGKQEEYGAVNFAQFSLKAGWKVEIRVQRPVVGAHEVEGLRSRTRTPHT